MIIPPKQSDNKTFKVKLDKKMADTWISYTYDAQCDSTYKRKLHVSNSFIYYGCFPVHLEPIGENSTEVIATISYDHYYSLPDVIHVKEILPS